jgi:MFS superfamily sulfate permease-like transporter
MHGAWILALVAAAPFLLRLIPTACLGAVLVYTGYKLINPKAARGLLKYGKGELLIYLVTVTLVVVEDLLFGVIAGVVLSALKLLYEFSHLEAQLIVQPHGKRADLHLDGAATFMRLPKLAKVLEEVPGECELHVHVGGLRKIDHACLQLLGDWERQHSAQGGHVVIDWDALRECYRAAPTENGHQSAQKTAEKRRPTVTLMP